MSEQEIGFIPEDRKEQEPIKTPGGEKMAEKKDFSQEAAWVEAEEIKLEKQTKDQALPLLSCLKKGRFAKWMQRGMLAMILASTETAMAKEAAASGEQPQSSIEHLTTVTEVPEDTLERMEPFLKRKGGFKIFYDRMNTETGKTELTAANVSEEEMEKGPIILPESLVALKLSRKIEKEEFDASYSGWKEQFPTQGRVAKQTNVMTGDEEVFLRYFDAQKNFIEVERARRATRMADGKREGEYFFETIRVRPSAQLSGQGQADFPTPVAIDLEPSGLGTLENAFYQMPYQETGASVQEIPVYAGPKEATALQEGFMKYQKEIGIGIGEAAAVFGIEPKGLVSEILLEKTNEENASLNIETLQMRINKGALDEKLPEEQRRRRLQAYARHETFHAVDGQFRLTDLEAGKRAFLAEESLVTKQLVEESTFLDLGHGGHAWQNPKEMFASTMNGLFADDWESEVREAFPDAHGLNFYTETLKGYQDAIALSPGISKDAPIHALLKKRIDRLEDMKSERVAATIKIAEVEPEKN
ncbi:hypothetical protein HYV73_03990 [Candidatus Uhrbacteria bacterium]|nr:hypothetical protein [Candidatus Uhrbacteria bacterium]